MKKYLYWVIMLFPLLGCFYQVYKMFSPNWINTHYQTELQTCTVKEIVIDSVIFTPKPNYITQNIDDEYSFVSQGRVYEMFQPNDPKTQKVFINGDTAKMHILQNNLCIASKSYLSSEEIIATNKGIIGINLFNEFIIWVWGLIIAGIVCFAIDWISSKK